MNEKKKTLIIQFLSFYSCLVTIILIVTGTFSYILYQLSEERDEDQIALSASLMAQRDYYANKIRFFEAKLNNKWKHPENSMLKTPDGDPIYYKYYLQNVSPKKDKVVIFVEAYNKTMKETIRKKQKANKEKF